MKNSDPMLLHLVSIFEMLAKDGRKAPKIQLELYIGGSVILGDLISSIEFSERSHRITKAVFNLHDDLVDDTARKRGVAHTDVVGESPQFLHLCGVEIWPHNFVKTASDNPSTEFWRVRISSIDAFHISDSYDSGI
jgi:hypothetical protein